MRFAKKHDHDVEIDAYPSGVHINRSLHVKNILYPSVIVYWYNDI
jgi:hypothetical protein